MTDDRRTGYIESGTAQRATNAAAQSTNAARREHPENKHSSQPSTLKSLCGCLSHGRQQDKHCRPEFTSLPNWGVSQKALSVGRLRCSTLPSRRDGQS